MHLFKPSWAKPLKPRGHSNSVSWLRLGRACSWAHRRRARNIQGTSEDNAYVHTVAIVGVGCLPGSRYIVGGDDVWSGSRNDGCPMLVPFVTEFVDCVARSAVAKMTELPFQGLIDLVSQFVPFLLTMGC